MPIRRAKDFLSRPRRFGKSLFLDTLDCAFSGRRELFEGLYLGSPASGWDWERRHPVLRIDWSGGTIESKADLTARMHRILDAWEARYSIGRSAGSPGDRLLALIPAVAGTEGRKAVFLVDEYDKPILDNLDKPQTAAEIGDALRDFYGALKPLDPHLRSSFSRG